MNLFDIDPKDLTIADLKAIRHYVSDLRTKADQYRVNPDPKAEALYYKAALLQSKIIIKYHKHQIEIDKIEANHAARETIIEIEKKIEEDLNAAIKRLKSELPGFKTAFTKAKPKIT